MLSIVKFLHMSYKRLLSPFLGNHCRFHPTCSDYALKAFENHGVIKGLYLTVMRVTKCNPLHPGGIDDVPQRLER